MKNIQFYVSLVLLVSILSFSNCIKDGAICFDFTQKSAISNSAIPIAGQATVTKSITNLLADQLTSKGVKVEKVNSITMGKITMTLPSTADFTFADFSELEILANGQSLGKLPTSGVSGLTVTLDAPAKTDVKSIFLNSTTIDFTLKVTIKKAIGASSIDMQIPLNTCYQLL
ncbi:MAG: hypothetical protein JNL70_02005 [Saprospiraceae bacterium]|nr:hypothetical protein [Saprospiraceae bacterium]